MSQFLSGMYGVLQLQLTHFLHIVLNMPNNVLYCLKSALLHLMVTCTSKTKHLRICVAYHFPVTGYQYGELVHKLLVILCTVKYENIITEELLDKLCPCYDL